MALRPSTTVDVPLPAPTKGLPGRLLRAALVRRALRISLFKKLFLANAGTLVLLGAGAGLVTTRVVTIGSLPPVAVIELLLVAVLVLSALANALVIRLALSPLAGLEDAARRVQQGDPAARAPTSPLADDDLGSVIRLFNEVLDWAEQDRTRRTQLSLRVLQAEERERERLGHALYAGTAQTLAGALVRMRLVHRPALGEADPLEEVRREVADALDEVRRMARRLHPPELSDLGVQAALEAHARHMTAGSPMRAIFEGKIPEDRLGESARFVLFRIVQEALSNAVLHSGGGRVTTRFQDTPQGFLTEVEDDGHGFDPERTLFAADGGLGLLGMRERAGYLAGSLVVDSSPGGGTRVRLLIPWNGAPLRSRETPLPEPTVEAL